MNIQPIIGYYMTLYNWVSKCMILRTYLPTQCLNMNPYLNVHPLIILKSNQILQLGTQS